MRLPWRTEEDADFPGTTRLGSWESSSYPLSHLANAQDPETSSLCFFPVSLKGPGITKTGEILGGSVSPVMVLQRLSSHPLPLEQTG